MAAVRVHREISGPSDAPTVVLAGSLGSTHRMWDPQVEALSEHFRVVRYDARGHGESPVPPGSYAIDDLADDLVALLDDIGVERAHLVGLSLGGMTGMRVAVRNPERVDRLVVLCSSAHLPPEVWLERAATVRADGVASIAESIVDRWFTPAFSQAHPDVRRAHVDMVAATPSAGYAACCDAIAAMDQRADLASIGAPTLAIAGADDPATPPEHLREVAEGVPDGRLLVLDQAAHLANVEQPQQVSAAIIDHLQGAPA